MEIAPPTKSENREKIILSQGLLQGCFQCLHQNMCQMRKTLWKTPTHLPYTICHDRVEIMNCFPLKLPWERSKVHAEIALWCYAIIFSLKIHWKIYAKQKNSISWWHSCEALKVKKTTFASMPLSNTLAMPLSIPHHALVKFGNEKIKEMCYVRHLSFINWQPIHHPLE